MENGRHSLRLTSFFKQNTVLLISILALFLFIISGKNTPEADDRIASAFVTLAPTVTIPQPSETAVQITATYPPLINPSTGPTINDSPVPNQKGIYVRVVNVVDGDTIKIDTGETVRYIGIDTPESVNPKKPVQCFAKEAAAKNEELVLGKTIELEKDISDKDRYGRLLRYIWIGETMVNEVLVRQGFAYSYTYPPDIKYQERFIEAQRLAREEQKGFWGDICQNPPTPAPSVNKITLGSYSCDCNKSCAKMSSCDEAQYQLTSCGCSARDGDGDGIACDSDCQ